ncbi:MAG: hypothetical protein WDN48_16890 [Pseudolabrys sp.]
MVNASEPLAAWLLRNAKTMGSGYFANSDELAKQQIVPAQTLYSFAIQNQRRAGFKTLHYRRSMESRRDRCRRINPANKYTVILY